MNGNGGHGLSLRLGVGWNPGGEAEGYLGKSFALSELLPQVEVLQNGERYDLHAFSPRCWATRCAI